MDVLKEGKYRNLKKGTPEYEELSSRLDDQFSAKYDAENKKVKPIIGKLRQDFAEKWTESESEEDVYKRQLQLRHKAISLTWTLPEDLQ